MGYGADLQEFLLRQGHVRFLIDNKSRRTFANADVNSAIALLGPVVQRKDAGLSNTARFVMFEVPFEDALRPDVWQEIEAATERNKLEDGAMYRTFPVNQAALLQDGIPTTDTPADDDGAALKAGEYAGNKWGGKYLRAPDIYYTLLERGKGKLVRLGDVADVRFGIKTGANEFFYLDDDKIVQWGIEERFLKPVIKSPRECRGLYIDPDELKFQLFMCNATKQELHKTNALDYIMWGEQQGFHKRPSCKSRPRWWDLGKRKAPPIVSPSSYNDLYRAFINKVEVLIDKRLYEIYVKDAATDRLAASLNSTLTTFFLELGSRTGLGEGLIDLTVYEVADCLVMHPSLLHGVSLAERSVKPYASEIKQPDRRALDNIIFDVLGLTQGERDGVYEGVIALVDARLKKAASFKIVKATSEE